ncbi:MAG: hypothetical protein RJA70_3640 [Pseudomonadota bacterium]
MKLRNILPRTTRVAAWSASALLLSAVAAYACGSEKQSTSPGPGAGGNDAGAGGEANNPAGNGTGGARPNGTAGGSGGGGDIGGANAGGANAGGANAGGANAGGANASGGVGGAAGGGTSAGGANAGGSGGEPPVVPKRAECNGKPIPPIKVTLVKDGFVKPVFVTSAPNAASPLYVLEKDGALKRLDPATGTTTTLATIPVSNASESGLLGMAFHPKFGEGANKRVFLFYVSANTNAVVEEYTLDGDTLTVVPNTRMVDDAHARGNHRGGMIAFGPDGYLYIAIGDGGNQNDGDGNAQNKTKPQGKILRIDVDNIKTPPPGNLSGAGEDTRIFHWGFRNPWRFSFDSATQDLYIADVGQGKLEEVTVTKPGQKGSDYGWPALEGTQPCGGCSTNKPAISDAMLRPQVEYEHTPMVPSSIVGGYVYRGTKIPDLVGNYFYADYDMKRLWTVKFDGEKSCENLEITDAIDPDGEFVAAGVGSFGQDANGEIYLARVNNGAIFRIDPK